MTTNDLRKKFLNFFEGRGHRIVVSDSLIPKDDPTILFTGSGMNQFKDQFLGRLTTFRRAASCQKCLRTADLEKVGKTPGHHTFFEMLGNFSFGDYFKEEAIIWAWEFLTCELELEKKALWVSIYKDDLEAEQIWKDKIKVLQGKIIKLGPKENFWPSDAPQQGPNGPCGPCSEIFYDRGESSGCKKPTCGLTCDCGRFVEVWNLVFTQFDRRDGGILEPLPHKNIDTGMGLERMASVLQGVPTNFKIDIFKPIVNAIQKETPNFKLLTSNFPIYAIADHIRAITFAIGDGVLPSNEDRGYVIRKLLRKSIEHGRSIGIEKIFLYKLVPTVIETMKEPYPELETRRENIAQVVAVEEERYLYTLREGSKILEEEIARLKSENRNALPGDVAFKLYDTYGFPVELTQQIVGQKGLTVDIDEFQRAMDIQRETARVGSSILPTVFKEAIFETKNTEFVGYENLEIEANVVEILRENKKVLSLREPEEGKVILDKTPFYGEAGGQVGDRGIIVWPRPVRNTKFSEESKISNGSRPNLGHLGQRFEVRDTKRQGGVIVHLGKMIKRELKVGDRVLASVDKERRETIAQNHTATHLLQAALRKVLGPHVQQSGSLVDTQRLRFDFAHFKDLSKRELNRIEELVNEYIRRNDPVEISFMNIEEAKKQGALAFFGEKYEDEVRVVSIGDYSKELCGGTHLKATGSIGLFKIINESSVASGVRRIEALSAQSAYKKIKEDETALENISELLKVPKEKLFPNLEAALEKIRTSQRELLSLKRQLINLRLEEIISKAVNVSSRIKLISYNLEGADLELMRFAIDRLKEKMKKSAVFLLGSSWEDKVYFVCSVTKDLIDKGLHAGSIVKKVAEVTGGSGGGRANFALGGGNDSKKLNSALSKAPLIIKDELSKLKK
jgi:alanyl-tRNA synthetase